MKTEFRKLITIKLLSLALSTCPECHFKRLLATLIKNHINQLDKS
jgi:elongation factor P--beta-lysine ligase